MKRLIYILILWSVCSICVQAQNERHLIREGNRAYRSGQYAQAETAYRKALAKNPDNATAIYNLGCALMKQENDSVAVLQFSQAAQMTADKTRRAMAYHNMGTVFQHQKKYGEAIESYKNALRNNPHDNDTRYNLALCKRQQQQQQQQSQNSQNNQKKENQEKKQDNKQNQNKDNQESNQDKQRQEQKEQISKQNAEQLLRAAMQAEKETQQRLKKAMQQPRRRNLDKNW